MRIRLLLFLLLMPLLLKAQEGEHCLHGKVTRERGLDTLEIPKALHKTELDPSDSEVYTIPVVFHVIYERKGFGPDALSDAVFQNQIMVLNEDFGRFGNGFNSNPVGTDCRIRFCLAQKDPSGKPTSGIVRVNGGSYSHIYASREEEMLTKNLSRWDQTRYLNIWVVTDIDGMDKTLGYSYLARHTAQREKVKDYDGVVMNFRAIGRNNPYSFPEYRLGRTCTHEIGHYLDLMHTWGSDGSGMGGCGDDDGIGDTPDCDGAYHSSFSPTGQSGQSCFAPIQCGNRRQIENYMDYSDDRCVNLFTNGQGTSMREAIRRYRPFLIDCESHNVTGCGEDCPRKKRTIASTIEINPNPASGQIYVYLFLDVKQRLNFGFYDATGRLVKEINDVYATSGTLTYSIADLRPGMYVVFIEAADKIHKQKLFVKAMD